MKKLPKIVWTVIGLIYYLIYLLFFVFYIITRILMAIAYAGMLDFKIARDVIKFTFTKSRK